MRTVDERFFQKVWAIEPSGCWIWTACLSTAGYGKLGVEGKSEYAHRISWDIHFGPIPDDLWVLHRCDVPCCVNPAHLFLGTHADNVRDREEKGRGVPPQTQGSSNGNAKLTDDDVAEIRLLRGVFLQREIAKAYGVSQVNVSAIQTGKSWAQEALQ